MCASAKPTGGCKQFEIGKMAAVDEFINRRLSCVKTVQRKLHDDPEGDFSSDLLYSGERPVSSMLLMQKRGLGGREGGGCKKKNPNPTTTTNKNAGERRAMW